jgi:hypothetical protein
MTGPCLSLGFSAPLQLLECPQSDCEVSQTVGLPGGPSGLLPVKELLSSRQLGHRDGLTAVN